MTNSLIRHRLKISLLCVLFAGLMACQDNSESKTQEQIESERQIGPLNIQVQAGDYAVPFCEKKDCLDIAIQSVKTQNDQVNQWIERSQSQVIQRHIGLDQNLSLQKAVDAYVKKSDEWQAQKKGNKPYSLKMATRIAAQRYQYVVLRLMTHSRQGKVQLKNQSYYFVFDRKQNKSLLLLDILKPDYQPKLHEIVQEYYQQWLAKQNYIVKKQAPKILYWGQADWFFDDTGISIHYRQGEVSKDAPLLDIYLTPEQSKEMLQESVYQLLFPHG